MSDYTCPLRRVVVEWDDAREDFVGHQEACGQILHLVWSVDWPLDAEPPARIVNRENAAAWAYTDSWEIVCENGHTVACSSMNDAAAEPCDVDAIMRAVGAGRS